MNSKQHIAFIIDDSPVISSILKKLLSSYPDIDVHVFHSGEEMKARLAAMTPDICIIDYCLAPAESGRMNGISVLRELRSKNADVYAILLTGMGDMDLVSDLKLYGFDKILLKENDDVFSRITDVLDDYLR